MRSGSRNVAGASEESWRPLLLVVLVSLGIRFLQLLGLKIASSAQAATGPVVTDGDPFQYFVFSPSPASPGLGPVLGNWDGQWYMRIATIGYPRAEQVQSATDAWASAFPPGFPVLTRATMSLTGLPFVWAALVLNSLLALTASVLLYRLIRSRGLSTRVAVAAGIGVSLLPASPVLVVLALRLLLDHRYLWMSLAVTGLAVTRPVALAFAPVVLVHATSRWRAEGRAVRGREWAGMGVATLAAAVSPWVWPWIAARVYGVPDSTQFVGSERTSQTLSSLGSGYLANALAGSGVPGMILVLAASLVLIGVPALLALRIRWPLEMIAWGASYMAMVIIVTPPSPSILRYLVLAAPLLVVVFAAPVARPNPLKTVVLALLVAGCLWSQWVWIRYLFIYDVNPFAP